MTYSGRRAGRFVTFAAVAALGVAVCGPVRAQWDETYFPNVELLTQDGEPVRFWDDLVRDKIVVVNFVYTECPDICGLSTARMAQVAEWLGDRLGRDIFFYSISLDPETDTPDRLKAYAQAFDAPEGWLFLTGTPADVDAVRYKLGERSRSLSEHRSDMVIGNGATGEWRRASLMGSLVVVTEEILRLDPTWTPALAEADPSAGPSPRLVIGETPGEGLFLGACAACHTVGEGVRVGPDLAGVTLRRDRAWLESYLTAPERMLALGDAVAVGLDRAFPAVRMPNLGLNEADIADVLTYLQVQTDQIDQAAEAVELTDAEHAAHHATDHGHGAAHSDGGHAPHQH